MLEIDLKYGRTSIPFKFDEDRFTVLGDIPEGQALSDAAIGTKLDAPIGSDTVENIVHTSQSVLIVVPDATRDVGCGQVLNILVRRLIASGVAPFNITIIFATGIHRAVTEAEKIAILTPFIAQRIKTISHGPRDLMQIVSVGKTGSGIPVELNRALFEQDNVVLIGGINFHYFAGFTGGRKLVCPGLASSKTIAATHKLAFDCERKDRRVDVGPGLLDGNAVHEAFLEAASFAKPAFAVNTIVNSDGEIVDLVCGDWIVAHRAACDVYAAEHFVAITEKRDLVVVSCGGYPHDIDLIQAHKALDAASHACTDGGTIILIAECIDGVGRADFLNWFEAANSDELAANLCNKYQVNGQTAWSLLRKAENYNIHIVCEIDEATLKRLRLTGRKDLKSLNQPDAAGRKAYIIPNGGKFLIKSS